MVVTISILNDWAEVFCRAFGAVLWQSTLLIALAALIAWLLRRSSPAVRYWLWQIVALKLLLMPFWNFYVPMPSWAAGRQQVGQPSARQPAADFGDESRRPAFTAPAAPAAAGAGSAAVEPIRPFWEPLRAIFWQGWLLLGWLIVVCWKIVCLAIQRLRLSRLLKQGAAADGELAQLVAELAAQIGLRRVPVAISVAGDCPLFVCGLWRPRLVLPGRLMASLNLAERRQVILHELAHVIRRDLLWGWPVEIARIVYFFHPLVYWAAYRLWLERELCCDQLAMAGSGHPPADYARTLVQVVSHASEPAVGQTAAITAGLDGSGEQRIADFSINERK